MNWMLIVTAVIVFGCMLIGYLKGLIKTVFSLGAFIAAIILVTVLSPTVTNVLRTKTHLKDTIRKPVLERLQNDKGKENKVADMLDNYNVPESISSLITSNDMIQNADDKLSLGAAKAKEQAADFISDKILVWVSYVVTFVVVLILIAVLGFALNIFSKLPLINGINRIAGAGFGFVGGLGCVWLLFFVISIFGTTELGQTCMAQINDNVILRTLYDGNLLQMFL